MNMALHRAFAAHRRMELSAQEGKDLAETLLHVASTINTTLEQDRVLALILDQLAHVVQYDNASIMLIEAETLKAVARRSIHVLESQFLSVPMGKLAHISEVIDNRRAFVITDTHHDSRWMRRPGSETIRCWLGVPLMVQDRVIGLLNLSNSIPGSYTDHHVQVAVAFAAHAAIAIQNAQLYTKAQQEIEERERAQAALSQSQAHLQERVIELQRAKAAEQQQRELAENLYQQVQEERSLLAQRVEERTSELQAANHKLTAALRTKDEFLATVSHELRTPLSAILLLTESMQNGVYGVLGDRHSEVLNTVKHSARHLLSLINDILDMSKIESGMFELDMGPVSMPIICRNSLQLIEEAAAKKQIELVQTIDPQVDMINGDERRLLQILVNLLSNAVKFTPDGGQVGLAVVGDAKREVVTLTVWDTGIGIAKEDIARLFQPFVQLDSKLSRQYEGTGLGLALVDRLAKMHGGSVTVESEVGKGSRFTVSIPWKQHEAFGLPFALLSPFGGKRPANAKMHETNGHATHGSEAHGESNKVHPHDPVNATHDTINEAGSPLILLVEDNEIGIEAMQDYLTAHDYRVIIARNGEEAVAQTSQCRPDLILMDIQMPDMDGLEATSRIRAQGELAHIPIIALTALAMPGDRERCIQAGANEYLSKPVSMKQLVHVIQSQLQVTNVLAN